jgi:hypothetical protein
LLESYENLMRQTGLFKAWEIRVANEAKLRARWKIGLFFAEVERGAGRGNVSTGLKHLLKRLELSAQSAMLAQRIGTLPAEEFDSALASYPTRNISPPSSGWSASRGPIRTRPAASAGMGELCGWFVAE